MANFKEKSISFLFLFLCAIPKYRESRTQRVGILEYLIIVMNEFCVHKMHRHPIFFFPNAEIVLTENFGELSNNSCFLKGWQ